MSGLFDLDAIRASNPLPSVAGASLKLRRVGDEWKACCPFHEDSTPSFTIFAGGERYHCFGCGAAGDVLDYVQQLHGVTLPEAAAMLHGNRLPATINRRIQPERKRDTTQEAVAVWRGSGPIAGTPAEAYLRRRGIHMRLPESLRFSRLRYGKHGDVHPCLVALVVNVDNKASGVQRTYLHEDGRKADVEAPKLSLGRIRGGAIRLAPPAAELILTGGLEDALSLMQELGRVAWAAAGEGNMASVLLPRGVNVVIGSDADEAGREHARRAAEAFSLDGRKVRILRPEPPHKDFNAQLMGGAR